MRRTFHHRAGWQGAMAAAVAVLAMGLSATGAMADKGGVPHAGSNGHGAQGSPAPAQDQGGSEQDKHESGDEQQPAAPPERKKGHGHHKKAEGRPQEQAAEQPRPAEKTK